MSSERYQAQAAEGLPLPSSMLAQQKFATKGRRSFGTALEGFQPTCLLGTSANPEGHSEGPTRPQQARSTYLTGAQLVLDATPSDERRWFISAADAWSSPRRPCPEGVGGALLLLCSKPGTSQPYPAQSRERVPHMHCSVEERELGVAGNWLMWSRSTPQH